MSAESKELTEAIIKLAEVDPEFRAAFNQGVLKSMEGLLSKKEVEELYAWTGPAIEGDIQVSSHNILGSIIERLAECEKNVGRDFSSPVRMIDGVPTAKLVEWRDKLNEEIYDRERQR